ncbi:MAG: NAD-dependent epimerase/dehydratase family protein [Armatimonadota bacterium]
MQILVTGAAGFIGGHVTDGLSAAGHDVIGVDDLSGGVRENVASRARFVELDLRDAGRTERMVQENPPDVLCHLAANAREGASQFQPRDVCGRNLMAYANVLVPCVRAGVKKVVLYSSMAVYGDQPPPFDETMPRMPVDIYGVNKTAMEEMTEILADVHGFAYTIVRPHNVFGERQTLTDPFRNVVAIFMNRIMRGEPVYIYGDGQQQRAFSYILDSLPAFLKAAELRPDLDREIINIGGRHPVAVGRLLDLVCSAFSADPEVIHLPDRPREVKNAYCTWEKSERLLGYEERYTLEEAIQRMAAWAKSAGPQLWRDEQLELPSQKAPSIWMPKASEGAAGKP